MKRWRARLTAREKSLSELEIQREIFHGDVLLPLIFEI